MWWPARLPISAWCERRLPCAAAIRSPPVGDADSLRAALLAADAIYFPDPKLATAGIHFAKVLDRLGIREAVADRLRPYPNGATAMREMASAQGRPIGCTQVTEILNTPGVTLVAPLPQEFELATIYTAAVATRSASPDAGPPSRRLVEWAFDARSARPYRVRACIALHHPSSRNSAHSAMSGTWLHEVPALGMAQAGMTGRCVQWAPR